MLSKSTGRNILMLGTLKFSVTNPKLTADQVMNESSITTDVPLHTVRRILCKSNLNNCIARKKSRRH